ncbi:3-oxoacyl-[acyl-carrier-protein] synthase 3 [Lactococcus hodotermopsidis]|uniref:Beta-ketoacyl-[acyl-carrier-protein] synthase III n=1 Tax=Pseudolactococcus hodotermopsidis TaxID=2709157 RepID=A0A6A0BA36_9LACT|nr:beta-ketoacyl-ACP synthase III [Lactococcus hodotermopsidis]GFH41656.1 3-oxoacyl-[acyl-carrier-protein] synthase 3 [Lactococcus hodotermopsidis]
MTYAKVTATAHYAPNQVVKNDDLAKIMDTSDEWISSRTGIRQRHISVDENTSELATKVGRQLLERSGLLAETLDFIIVATVSPDGNMPSTASLVQANLGAVNAFAFDLTAACSGFVYALSMADKLLASGVYQNGLVIGAEVLSKVIDWTDRATSVLFGDGAGGVIVQAIAEEPLILAESLKSDGSRGMSLTSHLTQPNSPFSKAKLADDNFLKMDGRAIFDFAVRDVPKNVLEGLEKANLTTNEIDYFLLHQANSRILDKMARKIKADRQKFLQNMRDYGNTSAASIPILLSESVENGTIKLDGTQTLVLTGFGGGLTWGTLVVKI